MYHASGGWDRPLLLLTALTVPMMLVGRYVAAPRLVEDTLTARQPATQR